MLNYVCPPELLGRYLPRGVELDTWENVTLVSMVGFMFRDTRVLSVAIPQHINFEEVNLRFYVRRTLSNGEVRRGVVFIRELVPKTAIAWVANHFYSEPYMAVPMSHKISVSTEAGGSIAYRWTYDKRLYELNGQVEGPAKPLVEGSHEEFITEHYWGYGTHRGRTLEYEVEHPRWNVWQCQEAALTGNVDALYGPEFASVLSTEPYSSLLAVGSEVQVYLGRHLTDMPK